MSDYASIVDRARRAFSSVSRIEAALERDPMNPGLQINLAATKKQAILNQKRLLAISEQRHIEVCNYRLLPEATTNYGVAGVSNSLLSYQNLFSQIHDAKINGPKSKAQLGRTAMRESALDFAYSFSGSLGVVLLVQSDRDFFDCKLDRSIEALFQVFEIDNQASAREIIGSMGGAVIKRANDWSEANIEAGFAADIRWSRSDGRQMGEVIERRRMLRLVDILKQSSDKQTITHDVVGILLGGNLGTKSFHFVVPDGESYKGHQADDFSSEVSQTLGGLYRARIRETKTVMYATERETVSYELVFLGEAKPSEPAPSALQ
jgi:hypothetical protein